jgi:hypothetical protein
MAGKGGEDMAGTGLCYWNSSKKCGAADKNKRQEGGVSTWTMFNVQCSMCAVQ